MNSPGKILKIKVILNKQKRNFFSNHKENHILHSRYDNNFVL